MSAAPKEWADGIRGITEQAAGAIELVAILPADRLPMLAAGILGDVGAGQLIRMGGSFIDRVRQTTRRQPMLCCACPRPIRGKPFNIVIAIPARDDPKDALTMGICTRCGTDRQSVLLAAAKSLKAVWPDARPIKIHPGEGRA